MAKLTLTDTSAGYLNATTSNANNALIEAALENTLSRDGTTPNTLSANIDMNSKKVTNLADGSNNQDAVSVAQLNAATLAGTGVVTAGTMDAESSTDGHVLTSDGAGDSAWEAVPTAAPVAGDVNAESSTDGHVLTSDGGGNAAWEAIPAGAAETNDLSAAVTWANIPNANVPEAAVTQHQSALSVTESQVSDLGTYATVQTKNSTTVNSKTAAYEIVLADEGETIRFASGTGDFTIPANSATAFPTGTMVGVVNDRGSSLNIVITTDTLEWVKDNTSGTRALADGGMAILLKVTSTLWKISGSALLT